MCQVKYCDDCGEKVFNGHCTWCHEEVYIAEQHYELGTWEDCSDEFKQIVAEQLSKPKK